MKLNKIFVIVIIFCFWQNVTGQNPEKKSDKLLTITGKVQSKDKEPVGGAVFYIDNVKTSYVTKNNGSYKVKVSPSAVNLEARSDQYGSCEIEINGQTNIDFTLNGLNEDGSLASGPIKESITADSVAPQTKTKAKKMNTYANIYQMIRAEVTGVRVNGNSIQIQQGHSFFGDSTPLFVINGVIVNSIDNVNPVEVKSIKVLTGSAAAIYGLRGSNGVLSITLLNGSEKNK